MAIRFKFRSSVLFDSMDMGGKPSISVRDLKFKILHKKKLDIAQGCDLLFSDALTGQEYVDESFEIPCGSSVIVKRLPAGAVFIDRPYYDSPENFHIEETKKADASPPKNIGKDDLDDFGTELYPISKSTVPGSGIDVDLKIFHQCTTQSDAARYSEPHVDKCNKIEVRPGYEAMAKDSSDAESEGEFLEESRLDCEENGKLTRIVEDSPLAIGTTKLPSWTKCLLCKFVLKDAMMIPCCQHNFCERCILMVLLKSARCPKCNSTKCKAVDLLPNIYLRQAIQRFYESQLLPAGSHNILHPVVPDGESGIQMRDVSCNLTILKGEPARSEFPSCTGIGSNEIMSKSPHDAILRENISEDKSNMPLKRPKRGKRSCYMCGSVDHLIRDCPAASSPYPLMLRGTMFQGSVPGYLPSYWGYTPLQPINPFTTLYANPGMVPSGSAIYPTNYYPVPFYVPTTHGGISSFSIKTGCNGFLKTTAPEPPQWASGDHASKSEVFDHQNPLKTMKVVPNGCRATGYSDDDDKFNERHRLKEIVSTFHKSHKRRKSDSSSVVGSYEKQKLKACHSILDDNSFLIEKTQEHNSYSSNVGRGQPSNHSPESLGAKFEEIDFNSCFYYVVEGHGNTRKSSGSFGERRDNLFGASSDKGLDHHEFYKKIKRKGKKSDFKSKHHNRCNQSKYSIKESCFTSEIRGKVRSHIHSRYSEDKTKPVSDELLHERWKVGGGSNDDGGYFYWHGRWKSPH